MTGAIPVPDFWIFSNLTEQIWNSVKRTSVDFNCFQLHGESSYIFWSLVRLNESFKRCFAIQKMYKFRVSFSSILYRIYYMQIHFSRIFTLNFYLVTRHQINMKSLGTLKALIIKYPKMLGNGFKDSNTT